MAIDITIHILLGIMIILMYFELAYYMERELLIQKILHKCKKVIDFSIVILISIIGILGCFIEKTSIAIAYLLVYLSVYSLLKEVYDVTVTRRQNNALLSKLQTYVEKEIAFLDIFRLVQTEYSKGTSSTWWVSTSKDRTKLVFSFKNMKYTYKLKDDFYKDNVAFIVKQLYENIGDIKTKEDIENMSFFTITDNRIVNDFYNDLYIHKTNTPSPIKPVFYNKTVFNLYMISGFIVGLSVINLIFKWQDINTVEKVFWFIFGIFFLLSFLCGTILFTLSSICDISVWNNYKKS